MGASDVFVAASWFESQGLTVIEAMIYKMPNIASAVEDILDSIMHEKTDILINKCSSDKTAINVKRLVKSPMRAKRVSEKHTNWPRQNSLGILLHKHFQYSPRKLCNRKKVSNRDTKRM